MADDSADYSVGMPPTKKQRGIMGAIVALHDDTDGPLRASSLAAPTMQLSGHTGSVYALGYSPDGSALCSASFDKTCLLWSHGDYTNYNVLQGHKNAVLDVAWVDDDTVATVGADHMVMLWDALTGQRLRKWNSGHTAIVNACAALSEQTVATAGDDGVVCIWDRRQKQVVAKLAAPDNSSNLPILALTGRGTTLYAAGIDPKITAWDWNMQKRLYAMTGHQDTVTSLAMHPEGTHVLSNAMDGTLKLWDIRPFLGANTQKRHVQDFSGHKHNAERGLLKCAFSHDAKLVTAGSADRMVHIWDVFSGQELYLLPGHKGCVNSVVFHPKENVVASGASDKQIFVGELS